MCEQLNQSHIMATIIKSTPTYENFIQRQVRPIVVVPIQECRVETAFSRALEFTEEESAQSELELKGEEFASLGADEVAALSCRFSNLVSLNLSMNKIARIDASLTKACPWLLRLSLSDNLLKVVHPQMFTAPLCSKDGMCRLLSLDLSINQLTCIANLQRLTSLQELNLRQNQISDLSSLKVLASLKTLNASFNKLTTLENLPELPHLGSLDCGKNYISAVPDFSAYPLLTELILFMNELRSFPRLSHPLLQVLNVNRNYLAEVELGYCPMLEQLQLSYN